MNVKLSLLVSVRGKLLEGLLVRFGLADSKVTVEFDFDRNLAIELGVDRVEPATLRQLMC